MADFTKTDFFNLNEEDKIGIVQGERKTVDDSGFTISFNLCIYKHDKYFYDKYKLFFDEEQLKKEYLLDLMMRSSKWYNPFSEQIKLI